MAKVDPQYLLDGLIKRGARPVEAAAIVGNGAQESGFDTEAIGDGGQAFGLWQHNGPRKNAMLNAAKSAGRNIADPDFQMDYVWHELNTSENKALKAMRKTDNPRHTSYVFSKYFERPNPKFANNAHRMSAAESFFKMINPIGTAQADETPWQEQELPDLSPEQIASYKNSIQEQELPDLSPEQVASYKSSIQTLGQKVGGVITDIGGGVLKGASNIGNTLLSAGDTYNEFVGNKNALSSLETTGAERRAQATEGIKSMGANPDSTAFKVGELGTEIAGTAGMGSALAAGAKGIPMASKLAPSLESWGMKGANIAQKAAGGAITGGASSALLDPETAGTGAVIGAALPPAIAVAGKAGEVIGAGIRKIMPSGKGISKAVKDLAKKAQEYGIDIPIDKIANSKAGNAAAKTLEYIPFAGREGTIEKMHKQVNRAVSKLIGEDTDNVVKAVGDAGIKLGKQFDDTLKNNVVKVDDALLNDLVKIEEKATKEFGGTIPKTIKAQIDEVINRAENGIIDGNAAYNLKRDLDRLGKGNAPEAFHFRQLKDSLMEALNRSLGSDKSAEFAILRKQYGNLKTLEKLVQNGAEGDISIARLAGIKGKKSKELKELADIAAQFVKEREGQHGAAQRAATAAIVAAAANPATLALMAAGGRATNMAFNSKTLRNRMIQDEVKKEGGKALKKLGKGAASAALRSVPVLSQQ